MTKNKIFASKAFLFLLGAWLVLPAWAEDVPEKSPSKGPKDIESLQSRIDPLISPVIQGGWCPGMVVGVLYKGKTSLEHGLVPDGDTEFETGSITKLFTQLLLLDMVQKGKLGLDDKAQDYLPTSVKLPSKNGKQITLLDLANHLSGLAHDPDDVDMDSPDPQGDYTLQQLYDYLSRAQLAFAPGESTAYSNTGVALLADIIRLKSGLTYDDYLTQRILEPLGLHDTGVDWTESQRSRAFPGSTGDGDPTPLWQWHQPTFVPVGGLHSTAKDMLKFAAALFPSSASSVSELAFGKNALRVRWGNTVAHGGGTSGFTSFFYVDRGEQAAVVVWGDRSNLMAIKLGFEIGKMLEGMPVKSIELPHLKNLSEAELKPYVGQYRVKKITPGFGIKVDSLLTLSQEKGNLVSRFEGFKLSTKLYPEDNGDFYNKREDCHLSFSKDKSGKIMGLASKPNLMGINFISKKLD